MAGKGSISKRDKDGYSWQLVVSDGYDREGKKMRFTKTVHVEGRTFESRKKAAERQLALFLAETEKGDFVKSTKLTLEEYSKLWVTEHAEKQLQPRTISAYKQLLEARILPALGHLKMQDIKPLHLQKFYSNLQEDGIRQDKRAGALSPGTVRKYHALLSSMFEKAVRWQIISFSPTSKVDPPKLKHKEMKYLSPEHATLILQELEKQPIKYKLMITLAIITGCRRGELGALQWKNIDLEKRIVQIRYSLQFLSGEASLKEPKNRSSIRNISIPQSTIDLLEVYKKTQIEDELKAGPLWDKKSDFVFTQWNGKPMHIDTITKWFPEFIEEINKSIKADPKLTNEVKESLYIPKISFHGLRHTAATLLIDRGLNIKAVSARLGHAQTSTTTNIYAHALISADQQASDIMEDVFYPKIKDKAL